MEQIRELLKDTGFLQVDNHDLESILKPGEYRQELIQWCLMQVDPTLYTKLERVGDDQLIQELLSLTRKLGICRSSDRGIILGVVEKKEKKHHIAFWLELLNIVKCVQQRNKLTKDQLTNSGKMWCELLQDHKYKASLSTKMNLIPIELKSAVPLESNPFTFTMQDNDSLQQKAQILKQETQELCDRTALLPHAKEISPDDLVTCAESVNEIFSKLSSSYQEELKMQTQYPHHVHTDTEELEETILDVYDDIKQKVSFMDFLVATIGFDVCWQHENYERACSDNLSNEIHGCHPLPQFDPSCIQ